MRGSEFVLISDVRRLLTILGNPMICLLLPANALNLSAQITAHHWWRELSIHAETQWLKLRSNWQRSIWQAAVPPESTAEHEAIELRDGDASRYVGKGVSQAVENVTPRLLKPWPD